MLPGGGGFEARPAGKQPDEIAQGINARSEPSREPKGKKHAMDHDGPRVLRSYIVACSAPGYTKGGKTHLMTICTVSTAATARQITTDDPALFLVGCGRWSCNVCGKERRADLCRRLVRAKPNRFLTLTCRPKPEETPRQVYDRTRRLIPKLFHRMNKGRTKAEYFRMLELHKSGFPHYHFLIRGPFWPREQLRAEWERLTGAFIVNIQRIWENDYSRHRYAIKYVTKAMEAESITSRTWTASKQFFLAEDEPDSQWHRWYFNTKDSYEAAVDRLAEEWSFFPRSERSYWMINDPNALPRPTLLDWELRDLQNEEDVPF